VQCPLLSLPHVFDTEEATIPRDIPYLTAAPPRVVEWKKLLGETDDNRRSGERTGGRKRVGLVWAGNPGHSNDSGRSMSLDLFAPLAEADVEFHTLQKGAAAAQAIYPPEGMTVIDHTLEICDFEDTAALIANLDLVITVDTSVAHLAGAMGKPVWVLITFMPDWRWLRTRTDSPWYPSVRLYRQQKDADWGEVVARVKDDLIEWSKS
jgi:hypothetical protein